MFFLRMLLILLALAALYLWMVLPGTRRPDESALQGWRFAHRGLHSQEAGIPENSLTAFRLAVENGYGIELDVHVTADGVAVVHHDGNLKRVCGEDVEIKGCTYAELCRHPLPDGSRIPTFQEVLALVNGQVPLIVEIKQETGPIRAAKGAWQLLRGYPGSYVVESFHPLAMAFFRRVAPEILRGQLTDGTPARGRSLVRFGKFLLSQLLFNCVCRPDFIACNEKADGSFGMRLMRRMFHPILVAWTIRSPEQEKEALEKGYRYLIFENYRPAGKNPEASSGPVSQ